MPCGQKQKLDNDSGVQQNEKRIYNRYRITNINNAGRQRNTERNRKQKNKNASSHREKRDNYLEGTG